MYVYHNQNCTRRRHICCVTLWMMWSWPNMNLANFIITPIHKVWRSNFNVIRTLTNQNLPMNWFFDLNAKEDEVYFSLCFSRHKFLLLLTWMVLYFLNMSPRLPSTWQWIKWKKNVRVQLGAFFRTWIVIIRSWSHDCSWSCLSMVLISKWNGGEVLFLVGYGEGLFLCAS
jgi:hypothetical protein